MRVVSDTSPISNLAIIGRLDWLKQLHGAIAISQAVKSELSKLSHFEASMSIDAALADGWLKVEPAPTISKIAQLHAGEIESIALAQVEPGTLLLMDEAEGRREARMRGIAVTGVVGVLLAARRKDWISTLKPELLALRERARFFPAPRFFAEVLASVGESP